MKQNLKAVGGYIAKLVKVMFVAPLLLGKVTADTLFGIALAVLYAAFNERENCSNAMNSLFKKLD